MINIHDIEEWKIYCVNYHGTFEVSSHGRLRKNGVIHQNKPHKRGYIHVRVNEKNMKLHQLVWDYFGDKKRDGILVINHIDNIPGNNHISNLELVTQKENVIHALKVRKIKRHSGESNHNSVLTDDQLLQIRAIGHSMPKKEIGKLFGVSRITVSRILAGRRNTSTEPTVRYNYQNKTQ